MTEELRTSAEDAELVSARAAIARLEETVKEQAIELVALRGEQPSGEIVLVDALAVSESAHDVLACAEAGIIGHLPREAAFSELVAALRSVQTREAPCPPWIAARLFLRLADRGDRVPPPELTPREAEILALIDNGLSNKEIARRLCVELPTVKNHVHHILEKLHVHRRGEAAAIAAGRVPHSA